MCITEDTDFWMRLLHVSQIEIVLWPPEIASEKRLYLPSKTVRWPTFWGKSKVTSYYRELWIRLQPQGRHKLVYPLKLALWSLRWVGTSFYLCSGSRGMGVGWEKCIFRNATKQLKVTEEMHRLKHHWPSSLRVSEKVNFCCQMDDIW